MIRVAVVGLGKMGISHLSIINAHPDVKVVGMCDTSKYLCEVLQKYTGIPAFTDYETMLDKAAPEAVIIATPSQSHAGMVRTALQRNLHIFCEKPFCLDWHTGRDLALVAAKRNLANQVGYHYRFVGAFQEVRRLIESGALGEISHVFAEAYGPVILRRKTMSWRTKKDEGGGCLYDYAAHPLNLLNWFFGTPESVDGVVMDRVFSRETDDEVYGTIRYKGGMSAQLSVNWTDESFRKMSVKISIWGSTGRLVADRQECQVYLRSGAKLPPGYRTGWNVRYTTELTVPTWFYLRGEEYSAQLDAFVRSVTSGDHNSVNSFASAAETDRTLSAILTDAESPHPTRLDAALNARGAASLL